MRRVLVTGGAGFIGSNFVLYLLNRVPDVQVVVFDKLTYAGNLENLISVQNDPRFSFVQGDVCDATAVRQAMKGCSHVLHFAAETHVDRSILDASAFVHTDVQGTFIVLEATRTLGIERFVHISTNEVYGNAIAPDGTSRPSKETDALKPLSPYAASKAGADCLAFSYYATYGLPVVITRGSNNYGPRQYPEKQLPLFILNALHERTLPVYGDGHHTRDWMYVEDHCAALYAVLAASAELVVGEVFNISTGEEYTSLDNAQAVLRLLGLPQERIVHGPDRLGHGSRIALDSCKIRERLGWKPMMNFHEGLAQTITWYQENTSWLEHVLERRDAFLERVLNA